MDAVDPEFDLALGRVLRNQGMARAASVKEDLLALGRHFCREAALSRPDRTSTADDSARGFHVSGLGKNALGKAAGSLYTTKDWVKLEGVTRQSRNTDNHARPQQVWRLR